jgi:hypothetical protein
MTELNENNDDIYEALVDGEDELKMIDKAMEALRVLKSNLIDKNEI